MNSLTEFPVACLLWTSWLFFLVTLKRQGENFVLWTSKWILRTTRRVKRDFWSNPLYSLNNAISVWPKLFHNEAEIQRMNWAQQDWKKKIQGSHRCFQREADRPSYPPSSSRKEEQTLRFQKQQLLWAAESGRETSSSTGSTASKACLPTALQLPLLAALRCRPSARKQTRGEPEPGAGGWGWTEVPGQEAGDRQQS